jgi:hypothetical protein
MSETIRIERVLRAMPMQLVHYYLQDLGGRSSSEEDVQGPGWKAHMERLEDFQIGSIRVGQLLFILEGEAVVIDDLLPRLELKLMRAGA